MTTFIDLPSDTFTSATIQNAAEWLQAGHLLAYPTESVWGIGCDPFNRQAVEQVLALKNRPIEKGMIVVTDSVDRIAPFLTALDPKTCQQVIKSWQAGADNAQRQAHTWLLPLPTSLPVSIPDWITGNHHSVAVRVINHPLVQKLCAQMVSDTNPYGFIVSTSCNPSGQPPALTITQAMAYFEHHSAAQVAYLAGDTLGFELPSQIHDAISGQIIR